MVAGKEINKPMYINQRVCRRIVDASAVFPLPVYSGGIFKSKADFEPWFGPKVMTICYLVMVGIAIK